MVKKESYKVKNFPSAGRTPPSRHYPECSYCVFHSLANSFPETLRFTYKLGGQVTNLMHNSFILQQYVCYITILNMFRAARCSSSGGQIVLLQPLVSSLSVNSRTVCKFTESDDTRGYSNTICPPEDEQGAARNMLRIVM